MGQAAAGNPSGQPTHRLATVFSQHPGWYLGARLPRCHLGRDVEASATGVGVFAFHMLRSGGRCARG